MININDLFYKGSHDLVLSETIDKLGYQRNSEDTSAIVAALSFKGRMMEAEALFQASCPKDQQQQAIFYLTLGFTRSLKMEKARRYLAQALWATRISTHESKFYAWQGLAFYYHQNHRNQKAYHYAKKALKAATLHNHFFEKSLARDLLGHATIRQGLVKSGLKLLDEAKGLFEQMEHSQYVAVIQAAILGYRISTEANIKQAISLVESLTQAPEQEVNNYTTYYGLLERAHRLALSGALSLAKQYLHDAGAAILRSGHEGHRRLWLLRSAYYEFLSGQDQKANRFLDDLESEPHQSPEMMLKAIGLRQRMKPGDSNRLDHLTNLYGDRCAIRMMKRSSEQETGLYGEDPLGDLMDRLYDKKTPISEAFSLALEHHFLILLPQILQLERGASAIVHISDMNATCLFHQGNTSVLKPGLSQQNIKILRALSTLQTKQSLIETVWQHKYSPLRHDSLVYSTMSRLRQLLGETFDFIDSDDEGYQLKPHAKLKIKSILSPRKPQPELNQWDNDLGVNLRQSQILKDLAKQGDLGVSDIANRFNISKITASRDLAFLFKHEYILRVGRGKATRYSLKQREKLE